VDDTVEGFIRAATAEHVEGCTFNLGTGSEISVEELAKKIVQKIDARVKIDVDPERMRPEKSEVLRLLSDNSLARERLNWSPVVSLEEGLDRTIAWIRSHLDRYRIGIYER
jgi:dTDP-glucose 4,6-dehydratase